MEKAFNTFVLRGGVRRDEADVRFCGMFEDEDDILVRCQGPDCSLRSADYEIPGVFHGRCAAVLGFSGGARWQKCPWCPRAKPATMIGVDVPDEEKYFISMTRLEEETYAARIIQRGWRWTRKRVVIRAAWGRSCKKSHRRPGDALWRVCQREPAPRKRWISSGRCNQP